MIQTGTLQTARAVTFPDHKYFRGSIDFLFEGDRDGDRVPQAFLVHQEPGSVLTAHYHLEDQFQVFVGGAGKIGAHDISPVSVHFASRESGYGPLVAGPSGLDYFSLRAITHRGVYALPESRAQMMPGLKKRQKTVEHVSFEDFPDCRPIVEPDDSGLGAWRVSAAANEQVRLPRHPGGGGCFYVVSAGSVQQGQACLPVHACVFASPDEAPPEFTAQQQGAQLCCSSRRPHCFRGPYETRPMRSLRWLRGRKPCCSTP